jgi:septum formation topological specificity factor MinE
VESHEKEGRPYIALLSNFSEDDLREFLETGSIKRLNLLNSLPSEILKIISKLQPDELEKIIISQNEDKDNTQLLKDSLFKIEHGLDNSFVLPILQDALKGTSSNSSTLRKDILGLINKKKLRFSQHENHRRLAKNFIENYLTDKELKVLVEHYEAQNA